MKYARCSGISFVIFMFFGCASPIAHEEINVPIAPENGHWITTQSECLVYRPNPIPGEKVEWSGACVDGKISGFGELTWYQDGEAIGMHTGEFYAGEMIGRGVYTHLAPFIPFEHLPKFTRAELAQYNGQDGAPAYVAYNGKVYDVSHSFLWASGDHQMSHYAGEELTESFGRAPHGFEDTLARFPVVGLFVED